MKKKRKNLLLHQNKHAINIINIIYIKTNMITGSEIQKKAADKSKREKITKFELIKINSGTIFTIFL